MMLDLFSECLLQMINEFSRKTRLKIESLVETMN